MRKIALPSPHEPYVDQTGKVSEIWYRYLNQNIVNLNLASTFITNLTTSLTPVSSAAYATQADQEAGTSSVAVVTPSVQQYHKSATKAWGQVTVAGSVGTLATGYNVSAVTFSTLGTLAVSLSVPFSTTNYAVVASIFGTGSVSVSTATIATTGFSLTASTTAPGGYMFACYGDQ